MFLVLAMMICAGLFGLWLSFWHRRLMVQLHAMAPDVWQRLGRGFASRFWMFSLGYPLWSWGSMFFFVAKRYERLGDSHFSAQAARFRIAFLTWRLFLLATTACAFWVESRPRPNQAMQRTASQRAASGSSS